MMQTIHSLSHTQGLDLRLICRGKSSAAAWLKLYPSRYGRASLAAQPHSECGCLFRAAVRLSNYA